MNAGDEYFFLPFLRQGLETSIDVNPEGPRASLGVNVILEAGVHGEAMTEPHDIQQTIQLHGPADLIGFDERMVVRTDPQPNVGDFEPNFFPSLEFAEPDFPWRFTPGPPSNRHQLLPWVTLIVLKVSSSEEQDIELLAEGKSSRHRVPFIKVAVKHLPDFEESWRWAHVQITGVEKTRIQTNLASVLKTEPERVTTRLLCARRLQPKSSYRAFVVPTFEVGRRAGLEQPITMDQQGMTTVTEALRSDQKEIELPYYYEWAFHTGSRGDFESLIRRLEPRPLPKVGRRTIIASQPGYGLPGAGQGSDSTMGSHDLALEGALQAVDSVSNSWGADAIFSIEVKKKSLGGRSSWFLSWKTLVPMEATIRYGEVENLADLDTERAREESEDKEVTIHSFKLGRVKDLPIAVRIRCHDALGNTVQFEHVFRSGEDTSLLQSPPGEPFRKQLAKQLLNLNAERGEETPLLTPPIYGRWHAQRSTVDPSSPVWIDALNLDPRHRVAAGYAAQVVRDHQEPLIASAWDQVGDIDQANQLIRQAELGYELSQALHDRWQRVPAEEYLRFTAPTMKHVLWRTGTSNATTERVSIFGKLRAERPEIVPALESTLSRVTRPRGPLRKRQPRVPSQSPLGDILERLNKRKVHIAGRLPSPKGVIPTKTDLEQLALPPSSKPTTRRRSRTVAASRGRSPRAVRTSMPEAESASASVAEKDFLRLDLQKLKVDVVAKALDPRVTISDRVGKILEIKSMSASSRPQALAPILAAPSFSQPMYQELQEISQELILPGVERVPNNTISVLKTNRRFIEAYMCGLNHEFSKELVWREYPTDRRGSYFRQFWDVRDVIPPVGGVTLHRNQAAYLIRQLGKSDASDLTVEERIEEYYKDIKPLTEWRMARLGENRNEWGTRRNDDVKENLVLLIRGDLLRKYPNTVIYAIAGKKVDSAEEYRPGLPEYFSSNSSELPKPVFPIFSAHLPSDLTCVGFPFTPEEALGQGRGAPQNGYYFILEERVSEARFGLDLSELDNPPIETWNDLTWKHFSNIESGTYLNARQPRDKNRQIIKINGRTWEKSAGSIASITLQRPVRIIIHASQMI